MAERTLADLGYGAFHAAAERQNRSVFSRGNSADGMMGYKVRETLFPGEEQFFQKNPQVSGMAAETGDVILNQFSPSNVNLGAVAKNEAFRLRLSDLGAVPNFEITDQQRQQFTGTPYGDNNDNALRATIAARIYSRDPSALSSPDQQHWVSQFLRQDALRRRRESR